MKMKHQNSIFVLLLLAVALQSALWGRTCTSRDYDKAEYFSDKAAKKIISKYGGGDDIRMEMHSCGYNSYSEEFKTDISIYWNGSLIGSNHYNVDGILKFKSDGTLIDFSKTYENQAVKDLGFWQGVIVFAALAAENSGNRLYFTNHCSDVVKLKIYYRDTSKNWKSEGWWRFDPGESAYLRSNDAFLRTDSAVLYFHAEKDYSGKRINSYDKEIDGSIMQKVYDENGDTEWSVCD